MLNLFLTTNIYMFFWNCHITDNNKKSVYVKNINNIFKHSRCFQKVTINLWQQERRSFNDCIGNTYYNLKHLNVSSQSFFICSMSLIRVVRTYKENAADVNVSRNTVGLEETPVCPVWQLLYTWIRIIWLVCA